MSGSTNFDISIQYQVPGSDEVKTITLQLPGDFLQCLIQAIMKIVQGGNILDALLSFFLCLFQGGDDDNGDDNPTPNPHRDIHRC